MFDPNGLAHKFHLNELERQAQSAMDKSRKPGAYINTSSAGIVIVVGLVALVIGFLPMG